MDEKNQRWWQLDVAELIKGAGSSENGLAGAEAKARLEKYGPNELEEKKRKTPFVIFINQFKDFMILVLLAAAIVAGFAGDITDTIIIAVIVVLNAVVGFIQENKAEKAMEALKKISALQAHVIRDGRSLTIPAAELVEGDVVTLEAGNVVPADVRLMEAHSLRINESALTGESVASEKSHKPLPQEDLSVGDRLNMAYKSTLVTHGRAKAMVVRTGMNTEIGSIARMLQQGEEMTPLQKRMGDFGRKLSYVVIGVCILFFAVGYFRNQKPLELLLTSISLAVAAIPEALPALITVALARGAKRLVRKHALVRKLSAVETLGSVTFICTDKTGTLTVNKMKVTQVADEPTAENKIEDLSLLQLGMALNHDIKSDNDGRLAGDATEIALVEQFMSDHKKEKYELVRRNLPRVAELPFDSERKSMTTIHRFDGKHLSITKGAIESVTSFLKDKQVNERLLDTANTWAGEGARVIAFAYRIFDHLPAQIEPETVEKDLVFAGMTGMIDPPREEARQAIGECKSAGINTVMITGDHLATATSIARQLGILSSNDLSITGDQLRQMPDAEFDSKVEQIRVYARVSPEQKLRIVKALKAKHHFVSMTGDGVNDAPALKASDIGVAMGINGTDVSKEASDMILLDDNFATIVNAIREGRHIYDNIRKFVKYIMTCNSAEILTMFIAPLIGLPIPLLPIHILWINLVTDGLPGLALASEKTEQDIMQRAPRKTNESLFADGMSYHIIWVGILMALLTLGMEYWSVETENSKWQTMVFTTLSFSQLAHVMAIRSERQSLFQLGFFSNRPLIGAISITVLLQLMVIYLPPANKIFRTQPLTLAQFGLCVCLSLVIVVAVEIEKYVKKRKAA